MAEAPGTGINRRRVLQGTAWAVPAVLIATAVPARAGSLPVPGGVALTGLAASMIEASFNVRAAVAYVDGDPASPDVAVSGVVVGVQVRTDRLKPGLPVVNSAQWAFLTSAPAGALTVFTFSWMGPDLLGPADVTAPLDVTLPKLDLLDPLEVIFTADGVSGATAPHYQASMFAAVGAHLVLNSGGSAIQYQQTTGVNQYLYAFDGTTRWAGPYWPVGSDATGLVVTVRIPTANCSGQLTPQDIGPDWTLQSGPTVEGSEYVVVFSYGKALTPTWQNTSTLRFGLGVTLPGVINIATLRTEAVSAGFPVFDQMQGPASTAIIGWEGFSRYPVGGEITNPYGHPGD